MAEKLTEQQLQAITNRGGKLLVSAAAGSGKTKVLVDRLMGYMTDPIRPANIDEFLIITYTKAAAAELRGKIATKISERIAVEPYNRHLQQQLQRLHLTQISTVHAFCGEILREYAYMLDLPADFRVADENECLEYQAGAMQQLLNEAYADVQKDTDFSTFVNTQGFGRDDRRVPEIILKVYHSAMCHLDPDAWLNWSIGFDKQAQIEDVSQTVWGKYLIDDLHAYLDLQITALTNAYKAAENAFDMDKPAQLLRVTVSQLQSLRECTLWDQIVKHEPIDYGRLTFSKKCVDTEVIEQIKAVRDACKAGLSKRLERFRDCSTVVLADLAGCHSAARGLVGLVRRFRQIYGQIKRSRHVLDFADLEHKTLDLVLGRSRSGTTRTAIEIGNRFREVMVDEYQDSNNVQDAIFSALTEQRNNCFMVGDVKQSIYQFRLADPTIFIDKYNRFMPAESAVQGQGRKVLLSSNFRSSGAVIKAVNDVFTTCMSPQVGGLSYSEDEKLYEGIPHVPLNDQEIELYALDVQSDTYVEEAAFVASRIKTLLDGTHMVRNGDQLRPIEPEDIVILLRSPGSVGYAYQRALEEQGIRCVTGAGDDLLQTEEIENLCSLLKVIQNPLQDIPLVSVLLSRLFGFTADELASIRAKRKSGSFYSALVLADTPKVKKFLDILMDLRKDAQMSSLSQLVMHIFSLTRIDSIYAALTDGESRVENLQAFCQIVSAYEINSSRGLLGLIEHLDALAQKGLAVPTEASGAGAVTLMSIHKSKGLEFPVVFLCGLAREFNQESLREQVLCDKDLGLGLSCIDIAKRIQYPSVAKHAIIAKTKAESISEELRVLYVAMTRAKDRLIMIYSAKNVAQEIDEIRLRMSLSDPLLLTSSVNCPGFWVLMCALQHCDNGWKIDYVSAPQEETTDLVTDIQTVSLPEETVARIKESLAFQYPYTAATQTPSKLTATQLKGRDKDAEAAQGASQTNIHNRWWRKPSFAAQDIKPTDRGNIMHAIMQYIRFEKCVDVQGVNAEIQRLVKESYLTEEQAEAADATQIAAFFDTQIGTVIRNAKQVLREFKFSVLQDPFDKEQLATDDKILLQGVVDCAVISDEGISIVDFKSDNVTEESVDAVAQNYIAQVTTYADALSMIYEKPICAAYLYFFKLNKYIKVM